MAAGEDEAWEAQDLFRLANERLAERVRDLDLEGSLVPFLCECADERCLGRVHLSRDDYEQVRSRPSQYVIIPGHATVAGERVVKEGADFHVMEKEHHGSQ